MSRFHGQRAIAAIIAALLIAAPLAALAQDGEGRPHIDRDASDRTGKEGRDGRVEVRSEREKGLEDETKKIDEKLKALDDRKNDDGLKRGEDRASEDHITKADEIGRKHDLTKPGSPEVHDLDTLLRETKDDERKNEIHTKAEEVVWRSHVDLDAFERLNVPDKNDKLKPDEASAGAEFESFRNCRLERAGKSSDADFVIASGPEKGKTVDFMLTAKTAETGRRINDNLKNYPEDFRDALLRHVEKADIVPIDTRHLDSDNVKQIKSEISGLPEVYQRKIILIQGE